MRRGGRSRRTVERPAHGAVRHVAPRRAPTRIRTAARRRSGGRGPALRRHRDRFGCGRRDPGPPPRADAASGSCCSSAATTCRASGTTGTPRAVFVQGKYRAPEFWLRPRRRRVPARGQLLRRRQHEVLRRGAVPAAARGLRRDPAPRRACRRPGRSTTTTSSPTTPRPSTCTWCTATTARTRPRGRPARSTGYPPVQHEPRIQQLSDDLEKQGLHPFHLPIGVNLIQDERGGAHRTPAPASAATGSTGSPAWSSAKSDAQVICVDPALEHDNVELMTNAHVAAPGDRRQPAARSTRSWRRSTDGSTGAPQRRRRRGLVRCGELRGAAAALGQRHAPERSGQQLRTSSAATTCGTTTWR